MKRIAAAEYLFRRVSFILFPWVHA
jgi:hypothetical protein